MYIEQKIKRQQAVIDCDHFKWFFREHMTEYKKHFDEERERFNALSLEEKKTEINKLLCQLEQLKK